MRSTVHMGRLRMRGVTVGLALVLALVASFFVVPSANALSDTGDGGLFAPASGRILDTANGTGGYSTAMPAKQWRTIKVAGQVGLPAEGIAAVSVMATVMNPATNGNLQGRPDSATQASLLLNYGGINDQNFSNTGVVAVGDDGTIQLMTEQANRLIIDVQGYYTSSENGAAAGGFVAVPGKRVLDTRTGLGAPAVSLGNGQSITTQITGQNGVPAGATAVAANFIVVNQTTSAGFITPYAAGSTKPSNSLNYPGDARGLATSIGAQVGLSTTGKLAITATTGTGGDIDVIVDIQGYFTKSDNGAVFTPAAARIADTRISPYNVVQGGAEVSIPVAGVKGIPASGSGLTAVAMTLSAINGSTVGGSAVVWPDGTAAPATTSINYVPSNIRSNTVIAQVGTNGKIRIKNNGTNPIHFILDLQGWFGKSPSPVVACEAPFMNGSWTKVVPEPDAAIHCSVTAPASSVTGAVLNVETSDGVNESVELSTEFPTEYSTIIYPAPGTSFIKATVVLGDHEIAKMAPYIFELGDWTTQELIPLPASTAVLGIAPLLRVDAANYDSIPEDSTVTYVVSKNADLSSPIVKISADKYGYLLGEEELTPGSYYWSAKIVGKAPRSTDAVSRTTPTWSFKLDPAIQGVTFTEPQGYAPPIPSSEITPEDSEEWSVSVNGETVEMPDMSINLTAPGCKDGLKSTTNIDTYSRKSFSNAKGTKAHLQCGQGSPDPAKFRKGKDWGWRHIAGKHGGDWSNTFRKYPEAMAGSKVTSWDSLAKVAMQKALKYSQAASHNTPGNGIVGYTSGLDIIRKGKVIRTYTIVVWVRLADNRIQSAYLSG